MDVSLLLRRTRLTSNTISSAFKFHERSYAERIAEQKIQTACLTTLYKYSSEIPGRNDTLKDGQANGPSVINPKKLLRGVIKGVKGVASTTTTALGNVASEIAGRYTYI
jgi:hypothetical protein